MEKYQECRHKADRNIKIADHMVSVTYPLVKDAKLLLAILNNIFLSVSNAMSSLLYYERMYKRIPLFQESFDSMFNMFRAKLVDRHKLDRESVKLINELKEILHQHKTSPVEFVRKDRFVICTGNYRMKTITVEEIKKYISKAKNFIHQVNSIVSKNDILSV